MISEPVAWSALWTREPMSQVKSLLPEIIQPGFLILAPGFYLSPGFSLPRLSPTRSRSPHRFGVKLLLGSEHKRR